VALAGLTGPAAAQELRFGAGQQGSQNYGVNAALAQAIGERTGLDATVQSFGGPVAYLPLLNAGEIDMAALVTPDLGDAIRGRGPFEGLAQDQLRIVAPLLPSPVALMVAADAGIESIADLEGKRVAWGLPSQASLQPYVEGALANAGLTEADVIPVPVSGVREGVQALIDGTVDATLFALRGGAVLEADSALGGIAWLPLSGDAEAVARMQEVAPEAYVLPISGEAGITGIESDTNVMAYDYVLATHAGADDETVRTVATLLRDEAAAIAAAHGILTAMTPEIVTRQYGLPYHPAAEAVMAGE
jgi:TRAP transporter TAXI family solute receptor